MKKHSPDLLLLFRNSYILLEEDDQYAFENEKRSLRKHAFVFVRAQTIPEYGQRTLVYCQA